MCVCVCVCTNLHGNNMKRLFPYSYISFAIVTNFLPGIQFKTYLKVIASNSAHRIKTLNNYRIK